MKKKTALFLLFIPIAVIIIGIIVILSLGKEENTFIRVGQVEMREYDVSPKIPGRIDWIKVDEGDEINVGDTIAKLTDRELKAKYFQAEGAVESARAQLNMLIAGARKEEIEMARRQFEAASSQFELAEKTFQRMKALYEDKLLSAQDFDVAKQKYDAARAQKEASRAQLDMAITGSRIEQKDMARGQLRRAVESLEEVAAYLDESIITSPISGIVSKRFVDAGELVATGYPVITIFDPKDVWVELNLPALELENIKIGDVLDGRIDGLGIKTKFKVVNFSAMADYANWRINADKATFETRSFTVKLKPIDNNIQSLRPGMTVRFTIPKKNKK